MKNNNAYHTPFLIAPSQGPPKIKTAVLYSRHEVEPSDMKPSEWMNLLDKVSVHSCKYICAKLGIYW